MIRSVRLFILLINSVLLLGNFFLEPPDRFQKPQRVYANLLQAMGTPTNPPVLRLLPKTARKATGYIVYWPGNPARIELSEDVLDLCRTFGSDADAALACLLGHELAHFQYGHGQKQGFFSPILLPANAPYSSQNLEALADRSGMFIAYLAGYDAFTIAPALYRKLYDTFQLPNEIPGYPTKNQRLQMVADTSARVRELAQLFEVGEIGYLLHDYDAASRAFAALISHYPMAQIANNLGASKLNQALAQMKTARDEPRLRFAFPVEFDADNRLLSLPRRGESTPYRPILTDALHLFERALAEQPTYEPAIVNLALTYYLLEENDQARQLLTNYQAPGRAQSPNALLVLAIVEADGKQSTKAKALFQQAVKRGAFRAVDNAQLFEESQKSSWLRFWNSLVVRRQSAQLATKPIPAWSVKPTTTLVFQPLPVSGGLRYAQTDSLTVYELPLVENNVTRWYRVQRSHRMDLVGLKIGSPRSRLSVYSAPTSLVTGARGTRFYEYRRGNNVLFLEYRDDRLVSWLTATPI